MKWYFNPVITVKVFRRWLSYKLWKRTESSIITDARSINKGAVVLYTPEDKFKFALALFKQYGVFNGKELYRYAQKAQGKIGKHNKDLNESSKKQ